ncbi:lysosome membrane protein 2-like isoform X2 [Rhodnius prolixus]|uniref:lysosome membrane protein 2-like isoform X2 n=1 Tax=Rhodnius prolixus TaxID=13249 RepID=UPI003D18955E
MLELGESESNEAPDRTFLKEGAKSDGTVLNKTEVPKDGHLTRSLTQNFRTKKSLNQYKGYTKLCLCGLSLMCVAYIVHFVDPIQLAKDIMLNMKEGSYIYSMWKTPPIKLYIKIFMFNITNADRFIKGLDAKLKVEEIGPYTYSETVINKDITWNENHTLSYTPERSVRFEPEHSIGNPEKDMVNVINIPLLLMDEGQNRVTMFINKTEDQDQYSIDKFNGSPGLKLWGYDSTTNKSNTCNKVTGTVEAVLFPRNINTNHTFKVYRRAFCRPLPFLFDKQITMKGGYPAFLFKFPEDILDPNNPDNKCYCNKNEGCLPKGLSDLSPCYYNIPVAISLPHFIKGNRSLVDAIDGIAPNSTKHDSIFAIQPEVGVPLFVKTRIQTNLVVKKTKQNRVKPFNNLVIPVFWMEVELLGLPNSMIFLLDLLLVIGPILQTGCIILMFALGLLLVFIANLRYAWNSGFIDSRTATLISYKRKQRQQEKIVGRNTHYAQLMPATPLNPLRIR